ncbi:MAG: TraB/GumN family protein [Candidatus Aquirickettsiella gammari]
MKKSVFMMLFCTLAGYLPTSFAVESYKATKGGSEFIITGITHEPRDDIWPPSQALLPAFSRANKVFVELDITNKEQLQALEKESVFAGKSAIKNYLSENEMQMLFKFASENISFFKMPIKNFSEVHICMIFPLITPSNKQVKNATNSLEFKKQVPSYEAFFLSHAKRLKKEIVSLEVNGALSTCEGIAQVDLRNLLLKPILLANDDEKLNIFSKNKKLMSDAFRDGKGQEHFDFFRQSISFDLEYWHAYLLWLEKRNANMVARLNSYINQSIDKETFFVLVGSLHLYGEKGILELLKGRGFSIEKFQ